MHTIFSKKVSFFILISTLVPTHLYSAHAHVPLSSVSEQEGKAAFQRLASWRLWQKDALDYFLFLSASEKHSLVLRMARENEQKDLPPDVELLMVSYLTYEQYYPKDQFQRLKKGPEMIEKQLLGNILIAKYRLPGFLDTKVNIVGHEKKRFHNFLFGFYYSMESVLTYLLQGKKESCWRVLLCCAKRTSKLRAYEEVIAEGWKNIHFVRIEEALQSGILQSEYLRDNVLNNEHFREATAFYMDAYHDRYVTPQYASNTSSSEIE